MGLSSFTSLIIMIIITDSLPDWSRFENLIHFCILTLMYLGLLFCVMNIYTLQVGTEGINNKVLSCLCQKSVQSYHEYHFCLVLLCPLRTVYFTSLPSSLPSSLDQVSSLPRHLCTVINLSQVVQIHVPTLDTKI